MSVNLSHRLRGDELESSSVKNIVSCDDLFIDELLNFSQEDVFEGRHCGGGEEEEDKEHKSYAIASISPQKAEDFKNPNESFSVTDEFGCLPMTELNVPIDDLPDLEWLSSFVDDSFCEWDAPFPAGLWTGKLMKNDLERETKYFSLPAPRSCFKSLACAKARNKRSRIRGRPTTMPRIKSIVNENGVSETTQMTWRCSHCAVQKTPQRRTGLVGAKTLCNACGIRYKSCRLLPEYRPACSPTFLSNLHSNHHLRVLEMRRKKEDPELPEHDFTPPAVSSFLR